MSGTRLRDRLREVIRPTRTESGSAGAGSAPPGRDGESDVVTAGAPVACTQPHVEAPSPEPGVADDPPPGPSASRQPSPAHGSRAGRGFDDMLGAEWRSFGSGRCLVVERTWSPDRCHGARRVADLARHVSSSVHHSSAWAEGARPPFLFFDLETTGLSGGAGTYAFLVGFGGFEADGSFLTRQYVLTRPSDEPAMLSAVSERVAAAGALVSFNGKSFDAPLLETRFLFHRLPWVGATVPHLDVLHPARRFWKAAGIEAAGMSPCSLQTLERQVLGAVRDDDVPGREAPARFFEFIRSGDAALLGGVLEHNRHDLLSLAGLTARLLELVECGPHGAGTAREAFALGAVYERLGHAGRAGQAYDRALRLAETEAAAERSRPSRGVTEWATGGSRSVTEGERLRVEIVRALARSARRAGRYDEAAARWRDVLEAPGCTPEMAREAAEALAIHHEHRRRDLDAARSFALRTLEVTPSRIRHLAVKHRLARLDRKLSERPMLFGRGG